jgi:hypothetical protein
MRGLGHKAHTVDEIPAEQLQLIDTCYGVGTSLSLVDTVRGADFQAINLILSLQAGEPYRIARSLALEAGFVSSMGVKMAPRVRRLLDISDSLAQHIKNPHAIGMVILLSGISAYEGGELRRARDQCFAAEEVLRTQCSGVAWEIACGQLFGSWARYRLGDIASLVERVPVLEREATERGDLYGRLVMALGCPRIAMTLVTDRPAEHRQIAEEAIASWPGNYYQLQHYWADYALCHIDLYAGQAEAAWQRITRSWPLLKRAMLLRVEEVNIYMSEMRARIALALAAKTNKPKPYLDFADKVARMLAGKPILWATGMASLLRAQIANIAGKPERELQLLTHAQSAFEQSHLLPYDAVARLRLGALLGGQVRDQHVAVAQSWAHNEGVVSLEGLTRMLAPVFGTNPRSLAP